MHVSNHSARLQGSRDTRSPLCHSTLPSQFPPRIAISLRPRSGLNLPSSPRHSHPLPFSKPPTRSGHSCKTTLSLLSLGAVSLPLGTFRNTTDLPTLALFSSFIFRHATVSAPSLETLRLYTLAFFWRKIRASRISRPSEVLSPLPVLSASTTSNSLDQPPERPPQRPPEPQR